MAQNIKVPVSQLQTVSTEGMKLLSYVKCGRQHVVACSVFADEKGFRGKLVYLYSRFVGWHNGTPAPEMKPEGKLIGAYAWAADSVNPKVYNYQELHADGSPEWSWGGLINMALIHTFWQERKALGQRFIVPADQRTPNSVSENVPAANDVESMVTAFRASKSLPTPVVSAPAKEASAPEEPAPEEVPA